MPKFRNVITGLAVSTAMAGGALALSAVTAHASTPTTATISTNGGNGWKGHGHGNHNKNKLVNRNDFRSFKYYRIKKVDRNNAAFASGDAVIDIDGDDDD
ncbi:hypothetical protein [Microbispora triticiradicis]|uniref:hypothetical protein n=1 Tax=Microbispora triticiradicis TaxID=2200763 RepID=UPI001AD71941|nr:hypothetical protein [Microbispora triticiradicis]MBO4272181.1 hypothetical protein [Microbispora triticiradicis]